MTEVESQITCIECGSVDRVMICSEPADEIEMIACSMSVELLRKSTCDVCKNKKREAFLARTQVFEVEEDQFKIPSEHTGYDKTKASPEGQLLARAVFENRDQHLYISGIYDLGKSKATCGVLEWLKDQGKKVGYIGFNEMMSKYSTLCVDATKQKADSFLKSLLNHDYLLIDDFCKKRLTYSNCEAMYQFSEYIYTHEHSCKIWVTANFGYQKALNKWEDEDLGRATFSRFKRCGFLDWKGQSFVLN